MKSPWNGAAMFLVFALAWGVASAQAQSEAVDREAQTSRRAEAAELIARSLKDRMVRPVEQKVIETDARRIARALTEEQLDDLLAGREVEAALESPAVRVVAANSEIQTISQPALGNPKSDLLFVPVTPCRIIDTRLPGAGGLLMPGPGGVRHFEVAGTTGYESQGGKPGGCGIPLGAATPLAAAAVINFIAVGPQGPGHLRAWEFGQTPPNASIINYTNVSGLNIANGVVVPIAGVASVDKDLSIDGSTSPTFVVADVTGYFTRFPSEQFQGGLKSELVWNDEIALTDMADGACKQLNSCEVTTALPGTVVVEAWGQFVVNHSSGTLDRVAIGVETSSPVSCGYNPDSADASDYEVSAALGSNPDVDFTVSHGRAFSQPGGTTRTYYLSGRMLSGANLGDKIENSRMICTFIPD